MHGRGLLITLLVVNLGMRAVVTFGWVGLLMLEHVAGCGGLTDTSGFADRESWGGWPPGETCVYDVPGGGVHVDAPPTARLLVAALLVVWPASTVAFAVVGLSRSRATGAALTQDGAGPAATSGVAP